MTKKIRGWKNAEDKCFMPSYEDKDLQGATHKQIQQEYYEYKESNGIAPRLDTGVSLVVDSVAMGSMATDLPWVYVLDVSFDHGSQVEEGEYPGYFRVALESLLMDLYPLLEIMPFHEL
ncbi:hypothetical protein DTO013E5_3385 [Penicillium roqueforti]|nr:hypothetical protein CBS147355_5207 [Penicillium roqueforti]KAI2704569.1 hypothetical protein CBS147372_3038 [Penicillium roqueforti]KAI2715493.1 hypothetical protein CBS147318_6093 [Penicillium roqueforti]KAI2744119.1 hypothetical protein DTO012A1_3105 [Penicillium roqueforti]KAI2755968.1 hypothetical protein DTO013F2_716 [Penicillium roqueforti]